MLPRISYLDFAGRWFGQVSFDLASSGLSVVRADELGPTVAQDDFGARERFRQRIAERYRAPTADVVPCLGGSGALYVIFAAVAQPAGRVLVECPGYEPLLRVPQGLGLGVDRFTRRHERGFALDPAAIVAALTPETRMVVVTNPHNPSGAISSDATLAEIARLLATRDVLLFVDEAYLELAAPRTTAHGLGPNVVSCASATKCWGVPWARAGWALLPNELERDASHVERHVAGLAPPSSWAWGERIFERADALLARAASVQAGKRELVDAFMASARGKLEWLEPPATSLFGFVRDLRGICSLERIERGVSEQGVVVSPGEFFDAPGWFRLSWSAQREVVERGLRRLAAVLEL